jgi:hypothetical protein
MTEPNTPPTVTVEMPQRPIDFHGREIWVTMPDPNKLVVWQRTLERLQKAHVQDWNGAQVMAALERVRHLIDSILVHETDSEWIDDEMLAGRLDFQKLVPMVTMAVAAFQDEPNNRADRRAKKATAKKAARKAPAQ